MTLGLRVSRTVVGGFFLGCLIVLNAGCGDGGPPKPTYYPVSGTVTLDGKPMAEGSIVFDTADGKSQPSAGAIKDGKFAFEATEGSKIVRINYSKVTDAKDEYGSPISAELVGPEFNLNSTLTATVKNGDNKDLKFEVRGPSGM